MSKKFCPKCGKETEKFYGKVCENCVLSELSVFEKLPDKIVVKACKSCDKFFVEDRSVDSVEGAVDFLLSKIMEQKEVRSANYEITGGKLKIFVNLRIDQAEKTEEKILDLISKSILCESCHMKTSGYYQAVLQVRAPEKLLNTLQEEIEKQINLLYNFDRLAFISSIEKTKNGFDVYLGSKSAAKKITGKLKNKYNASTKFSRTLSGRISGKKVYRDTILISIGG
jgi:nonsense-mediated mRNA decay protein 3